MGTSAVHQALALPEILTRILAFLDDDSGTLASTIRVNKIWFDCTTEFLWRQIRPSALACVSTERQQLYASKIEGLVFDAEEGELHESFQHLTFSHLKEVSLDSYHPENGGIYHLRQYCSPTLEKFYFFGGELDDDFLIHLQTTCSRLTTLWIDNPGSKVTSDGFFKFISEFKSLEEMCFKFGLNHLLSDQLLYYLAGNKALRELSIGRSLSSALLTNIQKDVPNAFSSLQKFGATLDSGCVSMVVQILDRVTSLDLTIADPEHDVLGPIASIQGLREVEILFDTSISLMADQLLELKKLTKLEKLKIHSKQGPMEAFDSLGATPFGDRELDEILSGLPALRCLELEILANFSTDTLASLSKKCKMLEEIELLALFDLHTLLSDVGKGTIMFPHVTTFDIGGITDRIFKSMDDLILVAADMLTLIEHHFPNLETLALGSSTPLAEIVNEMFYDEDEDDEDDDE